MLPQELIRNFSIIAHIDHGKSTLADRLLEMTETVAHRDMQEQLLDSMDIERERGITIKAQSARLFYTGLDGQKYTLNLIDTPGHVDFHYEVSRSLAACEGALLVVDCTQGVEAQTIANLYKAVDANLTILPVLNKLDLPTSDPESSFQQLHELMGCERNEVLSVSAKTGDGVDAVLERIVRDIPCPQGRREAPLRALVVDSIYDVYRGTVAYVRVFDGAISERETIRLMALDSEYEVSEVGVFTPKMLRTGRLAAGEVGYVIAGIKTAAELRVGDTITTASTKDVHPLPGYRAEKPVVFCGMFPTASSDFEELRDALQKLHLNDASIHFEPENSPALGLGFRCGFLGMLHMEIVQERLEREYDMDLVITAPSVVYEIVRTDDSISLIDNPSDLASMANVREIREPYIDATIIADTDSVGAIMKLVLDRRGVQKSMEYLPGKRVVMHYDVPLAEVVTDFYDKLKSLSRGHASLDYEVLGFRPGDLVKVDMLINGAPVDALSFVTHRDRAYARGKTLAERLRKVVPRQLYEVAIQAAIGGRIIARESVKALRKNVTAKCYGGDITRKRKVLEKQKEGKRRMKKIGNIELPQEAFMAVLDIGD